MGQMTHGPRVGGNVHVRALLFLLGLVVASTNSQTRAASPAEATPDVIIYRGSYPGWPWIARTPSGRLVCVWREGTQHDYSAEGRLQLSTSNDAGQTWSKERTFYDEPLSDDRNVAIVCLSEQEWLVCFNSYSADRKSLVWTLRTVDGGETWQPKRLVCDLDARTRAAPVVLASGSIVLPFYKAPGDQSLAAVSGDRGMTWEVHAIANHAGFVGDEWDLVELPDQRLLGIIRNSAPALSASMQGTLFVSESRDAGVTWSEPIATNLRDTRSTSPAQIFLHRGRPVVLYADARMVSVTLATTDDRRGIKWNIEQRAGAYHYRSDGEPISDGSYPVSVPIDGNRRLIVDYVHDGSFHAIAGYFVDLPEIWNR